MSKGLLILGGAALLLMGDKKKKSSKASGSGNGNGTADNGSQTKPNGNGTGSGGYGGGGSSSGGGGTGSSSTGSKPHSDKGKSAGGIWVSKDCKTIEYEGGDPEAWWNRRGKQAAQGFINANYHDPYEIARSIIIQVVPCVAGFPIMEDGYEPLEEEYWREQFLRDYHDAYYLMQWLYNAIAELMDVEEYTVELDENCNIVFVGDKWIDTNAKRMARFYMDYMYPEPSPEGWNELAWEGADPEENTMAFHDNIALAIINRIHPTCAWEIKEAFAKHPYLASGYFDSRPEAKAAYDRLVEEVNEVEDHRHLDLSISFNPMS